MFLAKNALVPLFLASTLGLVACVAPSGPDTGSTFGLVTAEPGLVQQFTLTLGAEIDRDSPYGGCRDEATLTAVEVTTQDGLASPVKSGHVDVSLWMCLPGVDPKFHFVGSTPLLPGQLSSDLPASAHLNSTVQVFDQHVHPELDLRPSFNMTFNLDWTGVGDVSYGPSSHVETDTSIVDTNHAVRAVSIAGSINAAPQVIDLVPPVGASGTAQGDWVETRAIPGGGSGSGI